MNCAKSRQIWGWHSSDRSRTGLYGLAGLRREQDVLPHHSRVSSATRVSEESPDEIGGNGGSWIDQTPPRAGGVCAGRAGEESSGELRRQRSFAGYSCRQVPGVGRGPSFERRKIRGGARAGQVRVQV